MMSRITSTLICIAALLAVGVSALAELTTLPASRPADPTMDFLLNTAAPSTQPATTLPTTLPVGTLINPALSNDTRAIVVTLSDGKTLRGRASTTVNRPLRIWDPAVKDYRDIPFALIKSADARVLWERDEREWTFKESGSDVKIYSGRTYPARELEYVITLVNGETITGGIVAPLHVEIDGATKTFVLHKRDKGPIGQKLADLVYLQRLEFPAPEQP